MIPIGRKGDYAEWLTEDGLLQVHGWARDGLTDEQIAGNMGIGMSTYYRWQQQYGEFREAIKKGKAPVDIQVENALLKRALGYDYEETVTEIQQGADGREIKHVRRIRKHMPPEVGAIVFWLKNRRPGKWRDKVDQAPEASNELLMSLLAIERQAKQ